MDEEAKAFLQKNWMLVGCGVIAVIVALIMYFTPKTPTRPLAVQCDEYDAQIAAEKRIERMLKAPTQAAFTLVEATATGKERWTVKYQVDAPNSFGVMLRQNYSVGVFCKDGTVYSEQPIEF